MGWAASELVAALRRQVTELETDLRQRVDGDDGSFVLRRTLIDDRDLAASRGADLQPELELEGVTPDGVLDGILATVPVPR